MDHPEPDGRPEDGRVEGGGVASVAGPHLPEHHVPPPPGLLVPELPATVDGDDGGPAGLPSWGAAVVAGRPGVTGIPPWDSVPSPPPVSEATPTPRRWPWLPVAVVAALVGAGVGTGVTAAFGSHTTTDTVREVTPGPAMLNGTTDIQKVIAKVLPAVVSIDAKSTVASGYPGGTTTTDEQGTGAIITSGGEVVTNNHVIAGATSITVTLYGKTASLPATVVDADPSDDVALLRITGASDLPTIAYGSSDNVQVGDAVVAIGNALGLSAGTPTVTQGIISATGRTVQAGGGSAPTETLTNMFQTDAAINPGNSGGPLVDSSGKVIGMNTAVASNLAGTSEAQGIGFAIPSNKITGLLPALRNKTIDPQAQGSGYLGVGIETLTPQVRSAYNFVPTQGAVVTQVVPGSPAAAAGIVQGDVIVGLDGKTVTSADQLANAIQAFAPGRSVKIELYRGAQQMTVVATLAPASGGT